MRRAKLAAWAASASLVAACGSQKKVTEVVVVVDTNLAVPQQVDEVSFAVTGPAGTTDTATAPLIGAGSIALPLTLSLSPGGAAVAPLHVVVVGKLQGAAVIQREAVTSFAAEESRELALDLTTSCLPVTCADGMTCDGTGACVTNELTTAALRAWPGSPPARIAQGGGGAVAALSLGETHSCALTTSQRVLCWGANESGELGAVAPGGRTAPALVGGIANATALACSVSYSCARLADATARCWGSDELGQLGDGAGGTGVTSASPRAVQGLASVAQIEVGEGHACALDASGKVACWGHNDHGQLGDGTTTDRPSPVKVILAGVATEIAVGEDHTCALLANGSVQCWGSSEFGQLGDGAAASSLTPVTVSGLTDAQHVRAGSYHTCAVRNQRAVSCWGRNNKGQLGDGRASGDASATLVAVTGLDDTRDIVAGELHTCARAESGMVTCWGDNEFGQLGDGTTIDRPVPTPVALGDGSLADDVASGNWHTCARRAGGVRCWGRNDSGQLGDGATTRRATPVAVIGLP